MAERPLERAWRTAREERPWEPAGGWEPLLRRKRRELGALGAAFLLVMLPFAVVGRGVVKDDWVGAAMWGGLAILQAFVVLRPFWNTSSRLAWQGNERDRARTEHALRHHESVGADHRDEVTDRAEQIQTASMLAWFGWPVATSAGSALVLDALDLPSLVEALLVAVLVLLGTGLLIRSRRRARWARRWLADPLPRP